jgi:hypothetical protein
VTKLKELRAALDVADDAYDAATAAYYASFDDDAAATADRVATYSAANAAWDAYYKELRKQNDKA